MTDLTQDERGLLQRIHPFGVHVYSPSYGGAVKYKTLIEKGLIDVKDVGNEQETILHVFLTDAGEQALQEAANGADR